MKKFCKKLTSTLLTLGIISTVTFTAACGKTESTASTAATAVATTAEVAATTPSSTEKNPDFTLTAGELTMNLSGDSWVKAPDNPNAAYYRINNDINVAYAEFSAQKFKTEGFMMKEYDSDPNQFYKQVESSIFPTNPPTDKKTAYFSKNGEPENITIQGHPAHVYPIILHNPGQDLTANVLVFINGSHIHTTTIVAMPGNEKSIADYKIAVVNLLNAATFAAAK